MDNLLNEFVEVRAENQLNALVVRFLRFVPYKEFVKILEYEYKLIRHYQLKKCIIDLHLVPVYDQGSSEYVKDVWFPTVSNLGIQHVAFVVPATVLGKRCMTKAHQDTESIANMKVKHFEGIREAEIWLESI